MKDNKLSDTMPSNAGEVMISINDDIIYSCPYEIMDKASNAIIAGQRYIFIPRTIYKEALRKREEYEAFNKRLERTAQLNNIGMKAEKEGRIEDAIAAYEACIALGHRATHAFTRLKVIYRRLHRPLDVERVQRRMDEVFKK